MSDSDVSMDFLNEFDDNRCAEFKFEMINDIAKGAMKQPIGREARSLDDINWKEINRISNRNCFYNSRQCIDT